MPVAVLAGYIPPAVVFAVVLGGCAHQFWRGALAGVFVGALAALAWASLAQTLRRIEWDDSGLRFTWCSGRSRHYEWRELVAVDSVLVRSRGRRRASHLVVTTAEGKTIVIGPRAAGDERLRAALEARVPPTARPRE